MLKLNIKNFVVTGLLLSLTACGQGDLQSAGSFSSKAKAADAASFAGTASPPTVAPPVAPLPVSCDGFVTARNALTDAITYLSLATDGIKGAGPFGGHRAAAIMYLQLSQFNIAESLEFVARNKVSCPISPYTPAIARAPITSTSCQNLTVAKTLIQVAIKGMADVNDGPSAFGGYRAQGMSNAAQALNEIALSLRYSHEHGGNCP